MFHFFIHDLIPLTFAGAQGFLVVLFACSPCSPMAASQPSLDAQVPEHLLDLLPVWRLKETKNNSEINKCPLNFTPLNMFKRQCSGNSMQWDYSEMRHTCIYVYLYIYTHIFSSYKHHKKKCLCNMCTWMYISVCMIAYKCVYKEDPCLQSMQCVYYFRGFHIIFKI